MEDIFAKSIQESQLRDQIIKSNISEGLTPEKAESIIISNFEKGEISEEIFLSGMNILEKAKKGNIGEIREWKSGKYRKTANGWEPVKSKIQSTEKKEANLSEEIKQKLIDSQDDLQSKSSMRHYVANEKDYTFSNNEGRLEIKNKEGKVSYLGAKGSGDILSKTEKKEVVGSELSESSRKFLAGVSHQSKFRDLSKEDKDALVDGGYMSEKYAIGHGYYYTRTTKGSQAGSQYSKESGYKVDSGRTKPAQSTNVDDFGISTINRNSDYYDVDQVALKIDKRYVDLGLNKYKNYTLQEVADLMTKRGLGSQKHILPDKAVERMNKVLNEIKKEEK